MWVIGVVGATSGCSNLNFLRGSNEMVSALDDSLKQQQHPLVRASLVREKARLEAMATIYQRAFPLSVARLLLCIMLVFTAGASLSARRNSQALTVQTIVANAVLIVIGYLLLAPVREAMADAVAIEAVDRGGALVADLGRAASIAAQKQLQLAAELRLLFLEVGVFALAALALTRPRSMRYFAAVRQLTAGDSGSGDSGAGESDE